MNKCKGDIYYRLKPPGILQLQNCISNGVVGWVNTPDTWQTYFCLIFILEQFVFSKICCISGYQRIFLLVSKFQPYVTIPYIKSSMCFYSEHQPSSIFCLCSDKTRDIAFSYFCVWLLDLHDLHWYLSAKPKKPLRLLLGICITVLCTGLQVIELH